MKFLSLILLSLSFNHLAVAGNRPNSAIIRCDFKNVRHGGEGTPLYKFTAYIPKLNTYLTNQYFTQATLLEGERSVMEENFAEAPARFTLAPPGLNTELQYAEARGKSIYTDVHGGSIYTYVLGFDFKFWQKPYGETFKATVLKRHQMKRVIVSEVDGHCYLSAKNSVN